MVRVHVDDIAVVVDDDPRHALPPEPFGASELLAPMVDEGERVAAVVDDFAARGRYRLDCNGQLRQYHTSYFSFL